MNKLLAATSIIMLSSLQIAKADVLQDFQITEVFYEPMTQPTNEIFTGTFTFDFTTNQILNLTGYLNHSMYPAAASTYLGYDVVSTTSDGNGGYIMSAFALNSSATFLDGGYNPQTSHTTNATGNAFITIDITAAQLAGTNSTLTDLSQISFGDCTASGLMGTSCMTGFGTAAGPYGTMRAYPESESVGSVPLPPAVWTFLAATLGMLAIGKKRNQSV
ncbi:MAG: hypothetical protein PHW13_12700 [Methylococcales bacterium]|nr:hypothetical protein [Methylococcales bacterium]